MKTKNSEKRALFFNQMLSRCSIVDKTENWKTPRKRTTSVDEKEKAEVKLHAALVPNITYWTICEPRRDTWRSGRNKGFKDRVNLKFFLRQQPRGAKTHFVSKLN